jgi:hypothetical protein
MRDLKRGNFKNAPSPVCCTANAASRIPPLADGPQEYQLAQPAFSKTSFRFAIHEHKACLCLDHSVITYPRVMTAIAGIEPYIKEGLDFPQRLIVNPIFSRIVGL